MKILYISNKPIYPKVDGGCVAMENFLNCLLRLNVSINHICISTDKHPFKLEAYPGRLRDQITVHPHYINTDISPIKAAKYLIKKGSYNVDRFYQNSFENLLEKTIKQEQYDIAIFESLFLTPYTDIIQKRNIPVFVRTHNVEHIIWDNLAKGSKGLKSIYLKKLAKDLKKYEIEALNKVDGILSITKEDKAKFSQVGIQTRTSSIPVAIASPEEIRYNPENTNPFYIASMDWMPNIEATQRLIKIFPKMLKKQPSCELHIAGKKALSIFKSIPEKKVFVHDFVDDLEEFAYDKGILVAPIKSGSGVRIKILEMLSLGIPIISTTLGAEGIEFDLSDALLIADSDQAIVEAFDKLVMNEDLRRKISENAVAFIQKKHNIEVISNDILEFINRK